MRDPALFEDIVQRCLDRLAAGATIDECVREYPTYAADLVPILETVQLMRGWQIPRQSAASHTAVRDRARFALETQRAMGSAPRRGWWQQAGRMVWRYAAALVVIFALFGTSVAAAQDDLPGDLLYTVKLGSEQARVGLAFSPPARADLLLTFAQRRVDECLALQAAQRSIEGSLVAIQTEYDRAWEAINMVAPAERATLIQRYETSVQSQQAALTTALGSVPSGSTRSTLEEIIQTMRDAQQRIQTLENTPTPDTTPAPEQSTTITTTVTAEPAASTTADVLGETTTPTTTTLTQGTPLVTTPLARTPTVGTPRPGLSTPTAGTGTPSQRTGTPSQRTATPPRTPSQRTATPPRTPTQRSATPSRTPTQRSATPRRTATPRGTSATTPRATASSPTVTGTTVISGIQPEPTDATSTPTGEAAPTPSPEVVTPAPPTSETVPPVSETTVTPSGRPARPLCSAVDAGTDYGMLSPHGRQVSHK